MLVKAKLKRLLSKQRTHSGSRAGPLSSAEAPLRKGSAGVKFRGRRRREPLPETTPNMTAIRGSHFVTRAVCVLMS